MNFSGILCLAVAFCGIALVSARVETLKIFRDDRRVFHIESFGFEKGGQFEIKLSEFELYVLHPADWKNKQYPEQFKIAFMLQRSTSDAGLRTEELAKGCFHETADSVANPTDFHVFHIPARAEWPKSKVYSLAIEQPGYYHLYFSNCEPHTQTSFELQLTEYNVDASGSKNFLSAGESSLPTWFFLISGLFLVEFVMWVNHLRLHSSEVKAIHHLMTAVLLLKIGSLFFESFDYHYLKVYGTGHGWQVMYYIFAGLKSTLMFMVIVLIGTGWSYLKPFLTERDKQIVLVVLVVQMMTNIAMVVINETSPGSRQWLTWRDMLHLLDMVCCCAILLPIVWSIRHLREAAEADGKAARNVQRLQRFRKFYLLVVSYIYFTRIIVFLLEATLPFELTWLGNVFEEAAALAFYFTTGYLFRPRPHNPYLALDEDMDGPDGPDEPELALLQSDEDKEADRKSLEMSRMSERESRV